jgi:hypothetical protein
MLAAVASSAESEPSRLAQPVNPRAIAPAASNFKIFPLIVPLDEVIS